ncbi:uncharacterized protein LOC119991516 [Tripterygium wilfordii]|uniref:uncharacterized protein LOC119991516 n=1 Tax=Tripterygium wilfordii TaxID=458696 RepID=UPI0018F7E6FE|nr:uncharacterized protein LOC119991516 [Tripterygium wilfordii]
MLFEFLQSTTLNVVVFLVPLETNPTTSNLPIFSVGSSEKGGVTNSVANKDRAKKEIEQDKAKKEIEKDNIALLVIQMTITEVIFLRISNAICAKQAWDILNTKYQGHSRVRVKKLYSLRRELINLLMKESELIKDYYTRVMDVVNHLRICGKEMPDKRVIEKILISLTSKYNNIVTTMEETKDLDNMIVNDLIGSLEALEIHVKIEGLLEDATERKGIWKRLAGIRPNLCVLSAREKDMLKNIVGTKGSHNVKLVGSLDIFRKSVDQNRRISNKQTLLRILEMKNISSWLSFKTTVVLGNREIVKVEGKGTVSISTTKGTYLIGDVMYVPRLDSNLLSVGQLMEKGFILVFEGTTCKILDNSKNNQLVNTSKLAMKATSEESALWHQRLGHLSEQNMKTIHDIGLVADLPKF